MTERALSSRDSIYLKSTSFEVFMISGGVFIAVISLFFLVGISWSAAWLIWPGMIAGFLAALPVHLLLARREYRLKLAELNREYDARAAGARGD
jgi:hypothetical protein